MVYISNIETKKKAVLLKVLNVMGQEVNEDYRGLIIEYYSDGTTQKIYRVR